MTPQELQQLAAKIQLALTAEELTNYLATFQQLEKDLTAFNQLKVNKKLLPMTRIVTGHLTLSDLTKLTKKLSKNKFQAKTLQKNSLVDQDNFVLFKKNT